MVKIVDKGNNNRVIGNHDDNPDLTIFFIGSDNTVLLGENCQLSGHLKLHKDRGNVKFHGENRGKMQVYLKGNDCRLEFGERSKCNSLFFVNLAEDDCVVQIGNDCLFSSVRMRPSDSHEIRDITTGERMNPPQPITVGNHVWIAEDAILLGGSEIGDGSVIGARSLVNGTIPANSLAVGVPARAVRNNIQWKE